MVPIEISMHGVTFKSTQSPDQKPRQVMSDIFKTFVENMPRDTPDLFNPYCFQCYLRSMLNTEVKEATEGSLRITVECLTIEILERLWNDYTSGHLNAVAEKCLLTDGIKRRHRVVSVKLKTTILKEDYLA